MTIHHQVVDPMLNLAGNIDQVTYDVDVIVAVVNTLVHVVAVVVVVHLT